MPDELTTNATLFGFLLVLARVGGLFVFAPIPGMKDGPDAIRVVFTLAITMALYPVWPRVLAADQTPLRVLAFVVSEACLGVTIGLGVAFITEVLVMTAQIAGLQAGYGYASVIDPSTQADSSVLIVFAQLFAGLLFFTAGFDRDVIRTCALSLEAIPPGRFVLSPHVGETMVRLSSGIFSTGLRLALPVVALLGMVDLSLALLGRVNSQLQLLTLAFPAKMLAGLALLAMICAAFERVFLDSARETLAITHHLLIER